MSYYRGLLRRRWPRLAAAVAAGVAGGSGCSALIIWLIHRQISGEAATGWLLPLAYLGAVGLYFVLGALSEYLLLSLSQDELLELRLALSRRVLALPLERLEEVGGARIMASLTEDLDRVAASIRQLTTLVLSGSLVLGVAAYLAWLSPGLLAVTLLLFGVGVQLYRWPLRRLDLLQRYWARLRDGWDALLRHYEGLTRGTKELLMHRARREAFVEGALRATCAGLRDDAVRGKSIQNLFFRFGDILYFIVLGAVLFVVPRLGTVDPGVVAGYVVAGLYVLAPISSIINFGPNFGEARVALRRLDELGVPLDDRGRPRAGAVRVASAAPAPAPTAGVAPVRIRLEGVRYRYRREPDDEAFAVGPLDLALRPGEITFVTGGNGSGKTTLLKLLCGLYPPAAGRITVDGVEVTEEGREAYRQLFSVVFADFHLFDAFYGIDPEGLDARAAVWLDRLELTGKVGVRGGRLSTLELSRGQRKRLALLTAHLEDRPVHLFDEWAADQDPHFRRIFYTELLPDLRDRGRTVVAITHDDAWYHTADRVVTLAGGRLVGERPAGGDPAA